MRFYLSSFKFGNEVERLREMLHAGSRIGHINNARDFTGADPERRVRHQQEEIEKLNELGCVAEVLDMKDYFGRQDALREKLMELDGVWVGGGNVFVLRQAMRLSGFDVLFEELRSRKGFFYGGYSAGVCVLCDSLRYIAHVDDSNDFPYGGGTEVIWDGLNVFGFGILPHYDSDHPESEAVGREVKRCIGNKWLFKVLRDGEVIIEDSMDS